MKTASLSEIKRELKALENQQLMDLCLRLARFKKDNKELLDFILYESGNIEGYIESIIEEMDEDIMPLNTQTVFFAKKTLRKILRKLDKYARYAEDPQVAVEINIEFLKRFQKSGLAIRRHKLLENMYNRRFIIIEKALGKMHSDLQFDYCDRVEKLRL